MFDGSIVDPDEQDRFRDDVDTQGEPAPVARALAADAVARAALLGDLKQDTFPWRPRRHFRIFALR